MKTPIPLPRALVVPFPAVLACVGFLTSPACAPRATTARAPESRAALAHEEVDPSCKGTVRERLLAHGVSQVTVALDVDAAGRAEVVRVLSPELTPAAADDVRRAFEGCPWAPAPASGSAPDAGAPTSRARRTTIEFRAVPIAPKQQGP